MSEVIPQILALNIYSKVLLLLMEVSMLLTSR